MAAAALAKEKVWFDKPSYDKAERLYFERMAKVGLRKILESTALNADPKPYKIGQYLVCDTNNSSRGKTDKCKDNKSVALNNELNEMKHTKTKSTKESKKNNANLQKIESVEEKEKHDNIEIKENEKEGEKEKEREKEGEKEKEKCTVKEAKEEKNKAGTKHRNRERVQSEAKEKTEQLKEQENQQCTCPILPPTGGSLANEVAKARQHIKQSLQCMDDIAALAGVSNQDVVSRVAVLEKENRDLRNDVDELKSIVYKLQESVMFLEYEKHPEKYPHLMICPPNPADLPSPEVEQPKKQEEKDDDVDLFGSDSEGEDAEAAKIREERLAAYAAKKSKKPAVIAKSSIILDVKPWDDETDMAVMESKVREIATDGLLWGAAKLVPLAFGIHKLQISCVVEDDKVSIDWLTEQIQEIEDFVQSVDIAAFNKI